MILKPYHKKYQILIMNSQIFIYGITYKIQWKHVLYLWFLLNDKNFKTYYDI